MTTTTANSQPRDADGRFVQRRRSKPATTRSGKATDEGRNASLGRIATLTFAIIMGVAGFVFAVFWIGSLVLLGILWGGTGAEHQRQVGRRHGVLADVVGKVVDKAKDVAGSTRYLPMENHGT
jgi:hypothetical protein